MLAVHTLQEFDHQHSKPKCRSLTTRNINDISHKVGNELNHPAFQKEYDWKYITKQPKGALVLSMNWVDSGRLDFLCSHTPSDFFFTQLLVQPPGLSLPVNMAIWNPSAHSPAPSLTLRERERERFWPKWCWVYASVFMCIYIILCVCVCVCHKCVYCTKYN